MTPTTFDVEALAKVAKRYQRFAQHEAHGVSEIYETWSLAVAADDDALRFLAALPVEKQQPNLLFAAVRHLGDTLVGASAFLEFVASRQDDLRAVMLAHRVQTNEPGRCATLLPLLALLPQPLALIEVGASAGLCLLPDHYHYDYGHARVAATRGPVDDAPVFRCDAGPTTPIPATMPTIVWRAGIDLHPIDLRDPDEVSWLETLVWPEHGARAERLRRAVAVAAPDPPGVLAGDLLVDLDALVAQAPADATVVVFHSAVLSYLPSRELIDEFAAHVQRLPVTWISNESPLLLPQFNGSLAEDPPKSKFLLLLDGVPVAFTGPHGQSIDWVDPRPT